VELRAVFQSSAGQARKGCTVNCNDPARSRVRLQFRGAIKRVLRTNQPRLALLPPPAPAAALGWLLVGPDEVTGFRLERATSRDPRLRVWCLEPLDEEGNHRVGLEAAWGDGDRSGTFSSVSLDLDIRLADGTRHRQTALVTLLCESKVLASADRVSFSASPLRLREAGGGLAPKDLVLSSCDPGLRFAIRDVRIEGPGRAAFQVSWEALRPEELYRVRVRLGEGRPSGTAEARLVIDYQDPAIPSRKVPLTASFDG